jgi:hypothetical protein
MWPALYNGQPFFFPDTLTYVEGADAGMRKITGSATSWAPVDEHAAGTEAQTKDKSVLAGRSVYYGALLYLGDKVDHFWFTVLLQAALLMLAMGLYLRTLEVTVWPELAIAGVAMGVLTSASFYVSFLMPDVFAAVTLLVCAGLIGARSPNRVEYCLWTCLLVFSLISHSSHVLIATVLLMLALLVNLFRRSWANWRGLAVIGGCLVTAAAAESAFNIAVTHLVGSPPLRSPFLMAHAIEDGPGYRYLRDTCPENGFKLCEYLARLPVPAEEFLWSRSPGGVFATASVPVRRELSAEQLRFIWAVLRYDPAGMASDSLKDMARQLASMRLTEFTTPAYLDIKPASLPARYVPAFLASAAYRGVMPTRGPVVIQLITFGAGAAVLTALFTWPRLRRHVGREQLCMLAVLPAGVVVNAAICGCLSGPHDRYQARVAWLIPFAALSVIFVLKRHFSAPNAFHQLARRPHSTAKLPSSNVSAVAADEPLSSGALATLATVRLLI